MILLRSRDAVLGSHYTNRIGIILVGLIGKLRVAEVRQISISIVHIIIIEICSNIEERENILNIVPSSYYIMHMY